jgi:CheY-like chemotaxis protein
MYDLVVIDDDSDIATLIKLIVNHRLDIKVKVFTSAAAGQQFVLDNPPSIIICDDMMPEMSGFDIAHSISRHAANWRTTFILTTSRLMPSRYCSDEVLEAIDDVLTKPFSPLELLDMIQRYMHQKQIFMETIEFQERLSEVIQHKIGWHYFVLELDQTPRRKIMDIIRSVVTTAGTSDDLVSCVNPQQLDFVTFASQPELLVEAISQNVPNLYVRCLR